MKKKPKQETGQSKKFIDAAKDLGADVDEATLREKLGKLAKAEPPSRKSEATPPKAGEPERR